jgi:gluconolactonase
VWCPDGTLVVTGVGRGTLHRIDPASGSHAIVADTGGGPNGAALCSDGGFLVTQNGGFDFSKTRYAAVAPPYRPGTPAIQRVVPDGTVRVLADEGLRAPNDLVVGHDGTVYFTDPGPFPPLDPPAGRVMALEPGGALREVARGFTYCNGIGLEPAGALVVIEKRGLMRFDPAAPGERAWVIETLGPGGGDGFAIDVEGRFYVASTSDHGIRVLDADGREADFLPIPGEGLTTNCCFGGAGLRTLFATEMLPGGVAVWEEMPLPGLALTPWPAPA